MFVEGDLDRAPSLEDELDSGIVRLADGRWRKHQASDENGKVDWYRPPDIHVHMARPRAKRSAIVGQVE